MKGRPQTFDAALRFAQLLSHTEYRSGEDIAAHLDCTRAAVWKQVQALRDLGVGVDAAAGMGYRLAAPLELLDEDRIRSAGDLEALGDLLILSSTDSTNAELLRRPEDQRHSCAIIAEHQAAGRGRRGRSWHSPFGRNIYLSLGWRLGCGLRDLSCLPLVVAMAASRAITAVGLEAQSIKWPNDLMLGSEKLGGCLVEIQGDMNGPCFAVMGIGLNVHMVGEAGAAGIDQAWTDLGSHLPDVSRNEVAAKLLEALLTYVEAFIQSGFEPFRADWRELDFLAGKPVTLYREDERLEGIARGVGRQGGLLVEREGRVEEFLAGEVTSWAPMT